MITFHTQDNILILNYCHDGGETPKWVIDNFKRNEDIRINYTFYLNKSHLLKRLEEIETNEENGGYDFKFGQLKGEYYKIDESILKIANKLYIHKNFKLDKKIFVAEYKISIFHHVDKLIDEDIYLGGKNENAISFQEFQNLLSKFPNTTEKKKYCQARLSAILTSYFHTRIDATEDYGKYINKKSSFQGKNLLKEFSSYEKDKYSTILDKLKNMLKNEQQYNEHQWQKEIIEILLLVFPKYIRVFEKVEINDCHTNKKKELDYLLIDSQGYIDIIEIKRPYDKKIVSKNTYRQNHIPLQELSGSIMQVEKYILHLNKWGQDGENKLNKKYKDKLPKNFKIKITNPKAMIILGRSNNLNEKQTEDFEIIKRKYKNIIDIITYDDLINRLNFIISQYT